MDILGSMLWSMKLSKQPTEFLGPKKEYRSIF